MPAWTAVFLDRDGTINHLPPPARRYVREPDELKLLPGVAHAIRRLNDEGIWVGVVTNQRGVSYGLMTRADLDAVHDRLRSELARFGASVDAIYACTHADATCGCRKPEPGMVNRAFAEHPHLERGRALLIGDQASDMMCAERARVTGIRLLTAGRRREDTGLTCSSLVEAIDLVVEARVA